MPIIRRGNSPATLINVFSVTWEHQDAVVAALHEVGETVLREIPGIVSASIHKSVDGIRVVNYVQWETESQVSALLGHARFQKIMEPVKELMAC
jgi:quinol monooxygenase YgiN